MDTERNEPGRGLQVRLPDVTPEQFKKEHERQQAEAERIKKETHEKRKKAGKLRLNELPWPENWTRAQKRRCVAACKRAQKKGYKPNSPGWNYELKKAGFKPNEQTEQTEDEKQG